MKIFALTFPYLSHGFWGWGKSKEKGFIIFSVIFFIKILVKTEILKVAENCERKTRNGDQLFVHFWGKKEIDGPVFQTSWVNMFKDDPIQGLLEISAL